MNWLEAIKRYTPYNEQEAKDKDLTLSYSKIFSDMLTRANELVHLTSSAFVINKNRDKTLMVHHNIYNSWAWAGGHADGDEDLLQVALKEVREETGVINLRPIVEDIFSLDIMPVFGHIKNRKYVAPHLHISAGYLIEADENDPLIVKPDENSAVKWIAMDQIDTWSNEAHMKKIYRKIVSKIEGL